MSYNEIYIGKIRNIDYQKGVGEIVTPNNIFMFTTLDLSTEEPLNEGDLVKFRGEIVQNNLKAFFVKKIDNQKLKEDYRVLKSKKYHMI